MKRSLAVALVLVLAAPLLLLGCGKDNPVKIEENWPSIYPDQSTPVNTVRRMAAALVNRDSVMTDSVYADDYVGTSIDLTDPSPVTYTFGESDEIRFVGELARSSSIAYVNVEFYMPASWFQTHYASDPPGWIAVQIPNFRMEIQDIYGNGYQVSSLSSGGVFEFTLRPTPDATSPTDTTWTIVRWVESRTQN